MDNELKKYLAGKVSGEASNCGECHGAVDQNAETVGADGGEQAEVSETQDAAAKSYLAMCQDRWFGIFDRSAAARKGWETRKKQGWVPKVDFSSPARIGGAANGDDSRSGVDGRKENKSELERITEARERYDKEKTHEARMKLFDEGRHIWDEGARNYFE